MTREPKMLLEKSQMYHLLYLISESVNQSEMFLLQIMYVTDSISAARLLSSKSCACAYYCGIRAWKRKAWHYTYLSVRP